MIDDKGAGAEQMPATIGRYQVKELIGVGAMGAVYKAFDPLIKRTLAIKTIRLDIPRQSPQYRSFIERFYHEARISGTLSHPNIVTLFDIGEEGGLPYLAMEFVEGRTISSQLEAGERFKPETVIGLVSQVASAIDYAHRMGVIHRDIKPSNLILFEGERVKVTDFGIAKLVDAEMTQAGQLVGTPSYMSPEQAMGEKIDGRSDIFSLGVCAFEMLSGEQPFPGNNVTAILYKLAHVDPIEPANLEMNGLVPEKWREVFHKVLAKKPDDRYQTAADFVRDLEYCLGSWFGAAMGDEAGAGEQPTVSLQAPAPPGIDEARTLAATPRPALAAPARAPMPAGDLATVAMAAGVAQPEDVTLPVGARQAAAPAAEEGVTLQLPPRAEPAPLPAAPTSLPTVMMTPEALAAAARQPPAAAAPPQPGEVGKTVMIETPPAAGRQAPAREPAPAPVSPATVVVAATSPGLQPATMVMSSTQRMPEAAARAAIAPPAAPPPPAQVPSAEPPVEAPSGKGFPTGLVVGLLALLVLGGAGLGGLVWLKGRLGGGPPSTEPSATPTPVASATAGPSPEPSAAPVLGTLGVESEPAGASVSLNGEARGVTPLSLSDLALGEYEVKVEARGFLPFSQRVTLADAQPVQVRATLTRAAPGQATLDVLSTPFGASVSIDGQPAGQTPLTGYKLKPGAHRVELTRHGYEPFSQSVTLQSGKSQRVDAALSPLPPPTTQAPHPDVVDTQRVYEPQEVDTRPVKVSGQSGSYPERAPRLRPGESVSVRVSFVVSEAGEVTDVKVLESGGKLLDDTITAAVLKWKYTPGQKRGVPVKVQLQHKQTFRAG